MSQAEQYTGDPSTDAEFEAQLRAAMEAIGAEDADASPPAGDVEAPATSQPKRSRAPKSSRKETTPVPAAKKQPSPAPAAIVPVTPPVSEPSATEVPVAFKAMGLVFPTTGLHLTDRTLTELESVITKGMEAVFNVAAALEEIKVRALYKEAGHKTFEAYLKAKWNMSKSRGYQYLAASKTYKILVEAGVPKAQLPTNEATSREFDQATKKASASQLLRIASTASKGGTVAPTAESVAKATSEVTGQQRPTTSSATTTEKAAAKATRVARPGGSGSSTSTATPRPQPTTSGLEPVDRKEGREFLSKMVKLFMNGTFLRDDTDEREGTVAYMRTIQGFINSWLAGSSNAVASPNANGNTASIKAIVAKEQEAVASAAPAPSTAVDPKTQRKGENAIQFAVRVALNPTQFDPAELAYAARALTSAVGLAHVKGQSSEVKAGVTAFFKALTPEQPKGEAKAVNVKVAPEAKALMAETKKARPQTGTDKRRAAEAAAKKSAA